MLVFCCLYILLFYCIAVIVIFVMTIRDIPINSFVLVFVFTFMANSWETLSSSLPIHPNLFAGLQSSVPPDFDVDLAVNILPNIDALPPSTEVCDRNSHVESLCIFNDKLSTVYFWADWEFFSASKLMTAYFLLFSRPDLCKIGEGAYFVRAKTMQSCRSATCHSARRNRLFDIMLSPRPSRNAHNSLTLEKQN